MTALPTLRQLEYLVALADFNSFSQAAENCHVTQSTLSAGIAALEDLIGQPLVDRSRRQIVLNALGVEFVEKSRKILIDTTDMMLKAQDDDAPLSGPLRLGIIPTIAPYFLPTLIPYLKSEYPALELQLQEEHSERLVAGVLNGKLDLIILALPYDTPTMVQEKLFSEKFYMACPIDKAENKSVATIEDLKGESLLLLEEGHCLRDHALDACQLQPTEQKKTFNATSLPTLIQMVAHGYGVTLLPEMAINEAEQNNKIAILPFKDDNPHRTIGIAWRKNSPRHKSFSHLVKTIKKLPRSHGI